MNKTKKKVTKPAKPPTPKTLAVNNLVVISDVHAGCRMALFPEDGIILDDGGPVLPSEEQLEILEYWNNFWYTWLPEVVQGEPFAVVLNGDALDGVHHGAVTQVSQNLADQSNIAYKLLKPIVDLCGGRYYHIRGTEAHAGKSGQEEERLAERLGAVPDHRGRFARWEMWAKIGNRTTQGPALVHLTHHIGTSGSMAYETSAVQKELEQSYVESARWKELPPDVIVRSHRHRNVETRIQAANGFVTACVTAGWQLRTPFAYRIAGGRQQQPQIGGTLVRCGDQDVFTRHRLWGIKRQPAEVLTIEAPGD